MSKSFWLALTLVGCVHLKAGTDRRSIAVYAFPRGLADATKGEAAVERHLLEIRSHLQEAKSGGVGLALNYPYTAFLESSGPDQFRIPSKIAQLYELILKTAHRLGMPVLVGFNGASWASSDGDFNAYWKTAQGGKFLQRYQDGRVNESIATESNDIAPSKLRRFLDRNPYDSEKGKNALLLTLAPKANEYAEARVQALRIALNFWKALDKKYPGTIRAFSSDSEVSDFSFRTRSNGDRIAIGFEDLVIQPFCQANQISDCRKFFRSEKFDYTRDVHHKWFQYRAELHRSFVQDSAHVIRQAFPKAEIYTHQLGVPNGEFLTNRHDFASPLSTAFVEGAYPGVTAYIYGGRDQTFVKIVDQISRKSGSEPWGLMEFNPGKAWRGTREELKAFTLKNLRYLETKGARVVVLLAWESNALDVGIKDSGVDDGIKAYLREQN